MLQCSLVHTCHLAATPTLPRAPTYLRVRCQALLVLFAAVSRADTDVLNTIAQFSDNTCNDTTAEYITSSWTVLSQNISYLSEGHKSASHLGVSASHSGFSHLCSLLFSLLLSLSISLSLSAYQPLYPSTSLSLYLPISLPLSLSISLPLSLSISLPLSLSICRPLYLSVPQPLNLSFFLSLSISQALSGPQPLTLCEAQRLTSSVLQEQQTA